MQHCTYIYIYIYIYILRPHLHMGRVAQWSRHKYFQVRKVQNTVVRWANLWVIAIFFSLISLVSVYFQYTYIYINVKRFSGSHIRSFVSPSWRNPYQNNHLTNEGKQYHIRDVILVTDFFPAGLFPTGLFPIGLFASGVFLERSHAKRFFPARCFPPNTFSARSFPSGFFSRCAYLITVFLLRRSTRKSTDGDFLKARFGLVSFFGSV